MPMSPSQVEREAEELGLLYAELELLLLQLIANRLARGIDTPQWAGEQLAGVLAVRQALQSHVLRTQATSSGRLGTIITRAYMAGIDNAIDDLVEAGLDRSTLQRAHISPAQALIREAELRLRSTHMAILRQTEDVYRQAVAEGARPAVGGAETRRQATQRILNNLADRGVSGFVDKAGRNWELSTYAEMTARTALGRAAIQGFIETAAANGNDLVIVSDSPEECELCRPWEGRVLSISGKRAGRVTMAGGVQAPIAGSINDAIQAGLFHPNCTHRLTVFIEGATKPFTNTANPDGYEQRQQQRHIERQIRKWKRRQAVALDDQAKAAATAKVRQWQAGMRSFIDDTGRRRQYQREQITR